MRNIKGKEQFRTHRKKYRRLFGSLRVQTSLQLVKTNIFNRLHIL